jgi:glutamate--cysteine ligase|tara:strand:- start:2864 stop:4231 length:1368 start_codon:yes stop_codon:yes gene_type:complete
MSAPPQVQGAPISSKDQLIAELSKGNKPKEDWRIGTEHEKFVFTTDDLKPLPYDGARSIRTILEALADRYGWTRQMEGDRLLALTSQGCAITLEPGGQFELSGAPVRTVHDTCNEVHTHLAQVKTICEPLGIGMIGLGFAPTWSRAEMPLMPKDRSVIMRNYMPKVGKLGLDMMHRSCTVQVNLDFADERDMVRKYRVSLALQPVATALFASSPFSEGKVNGFQSYRSQLWTDTDPDRCGMLPFVFEPGMGFERYVDFMLDVPMYFLFRDGKFIDVAGQSFRDFMAGKLPALPGEIPLLSDWADHLTTAFPEVRLKQFLEMRGADGGPWARICALPALWVGLLYDETALSAAEDMVRDWSVAEMQELRAAVPKLGLHASFRGRPLLELAREMLEISTVGLQARDMTNAAGANEVGFLKVLKDIVRDGRSPADQLLLDHQKRWDGDLTRIFADYQY